MSFIFEALKRAERERRAGSEPRPAVVGGSGGEPERRPPKWPAILAACAMVGLAAVLVVSKWLGPGAGRPAVAEAVLPRGPAAEPPAETPGGEEGTPARRAQAVELGPEPVPRVRAAASAPPAPLLGATTVLPAESPTAGHGADRGRPAGSAAAVNPPTPAPPPKPSISPAPPAPSAPAARPEVPASSLGAAPVPPARPVSAAQAPGPPPRLRDLPRELRERLGPLEISGHVYGDDPSQRFVFVNGKAYREGDRIAGGIVVERITPEGIVVDYGEGKAEIEASP